MNVELLDRCQGGCGPTQNKSRLRVIDSLGIMASGLCIVHCLALPFVLALIPAFTMHCEQGHNHSHGSGDITHILLAGFVFTFCLFAIVPGFKRHGNARVLLLMTGGLAAVFLATFHSYIGLQEAIELPLITAGNLAIISSHFWNRRLVKNQLLNK